MSSNPTQQTQDEQFGPYNAQPPREITRVEYWDFLEMMWPRNWKGMDGNAETFQFEERVSGDIRMLFCRIGPEATAKYYRLQDSETMSHTAIVTACRLFEEARQ